MPYAPGDFAPIGPFEWLARVNGELCGGAVTWGVEWVPEVPELEEGEEAPTDHPPEVLPLGPYALVRPRLQADTLLPEPVSPGVLTLTATVTLTDGSTRVLDPITLTLTAIEGALNPCAPGAHLELWYQSGAGATWSRIPATTLDNAQLAQCLGYDMLYATAVDDQGVPLPSESLILSSIVVETTGDRAFYGYALDEEQFFFWDDYCGFYKVTAVDVDATESGTWTLSANATIDGVTVALTPITLTLTGA